jgi:hypothetical protein
VLLLVFGAIAPPGCRCWLALSAVAGTLGLLALPSQLVSMNEVVDTAVRLIGLAVGVDYSLFYLKREREERAVCKGTRPPGSWEAGRKDTVIAYPDEVAHVKALFDHLGLFAWHCHVLEHEDNEMMRPYRIGHWFAPQPTDRRVHVGQGSPARPAIARRPRAGGGVRTRCRSPPTRDLQRTGAADDRVRRPYWRYEVAPTPASGWRRTGRARE